MNTIAISTVTPRFPCPLLTHLLPCYMVSCLCELVFFNNKKKFLKNHPVVEERVRVTQTLSVAKQSCMQIQIKFLGIHKKMINT
jgi:hypothetical protein